MRISDWSSDVCSSDLLCRAAAVLDVIADGIAAARRADQRHLRRAGAPHHLGDDLLELLALFLGRGAQALRCRIDAARQRIGEVDGEQPVAGKAVALPAPESGVPQRGGIAVAMQDRKSGVWGKSVSVRVAPGGGRIIKKKKRY